MPIDDLARRTRRGARPARVQRLGALVGLSGLLVNPLAACSAPDSPPVASGGVSGSGGSDETGESGETGAPDAAYHFVVELENTGTAYRFPQSGVFERPDDGPTLGPIGPGEFFRFSFTARPGDRLNFVTMLQQSNDWFVSGPAGGIPLFDADGEPYIGDQSAVLSLYDAGTEADQVLAQGDAQPAQAVDAGDPDPDPNLRAIAWSSAGLDLDRPSLNFDAELGPDRAWRFTVTFTNQSAAGHFDTTSGAYDCEFSPGLWMTHAADDALFIEDAPLDHAALEALVEDARLVPLAAEVFPATGVTQVVSAGVWAVTANDDPLLFVSGSPALDNGLEAIAEDGKFMALAGYVEGLSPLAAGVTEQSVVDYAVGPLPPGGIYRFEFDADPGAYLHLAHMFVPSNDWFIAFDPGGLALFDASDAPLLGPQPGALSLWDAGTEVNQPIGFGLDQVHLQAGADTGAADEDASVRVVSGELPLDDLVRLRVISERN